MMSPTLFWIFSTFMLLFGLITILHRNPVASALSLVVSFMALAALFVSLDAYFIGVIQVLVYAGAVMVLFLFIIMLLDLKAEQQRQINLGAILVGVAVVGAFIAQFVLVLRRHPAGERALQPLAAGLKEDAFHIGETLFTQYNLPLQVIGVLILVATIGVVVLSKRQLD